MAYIQADDKLLDQNQNQDPNQNNGQQQLFGGGDSSVVSGSGLNASTTSTAGIGKGGTGGWTNIQAYLNANQGDQGGSKLLQDNVGSAFQGEKTKLNQGASDAANQALSQVGSVKSVKDSAPDLIEKGAKAYDWGGKSGSDYSNAIGSFKNALNAKYSGPTSYNYAFDNKVNDYASNLGSDESFNNMMNDFYAQKGGGTLNSGQRELQKQLNISNEGLSSARQKLLQDYGDLNKYREQTLQDTAGKINSAQSDFANTQNALKDYLGNSLSQYGTQIGQQESSAKSAYDKLYKSKSGRGAAPTYYDGSNGIWGSALSGQYDKAGLLDKNLSWDQLAQEQSKFGDLAGTNSLAAPYLAQNSGALNKFYLDQNDKYKDTADAEKRKFNLIQDILGGTDKKKAGFNVFGDQNPLTKSKILAGGSKGGK